MASDRVKVAVGVNQLGAGTNGDHGDQTFGEGSQGLAGATAFRKTAIHFDGSSCAAGLLIVLTQSPLRCDFHPAAAGRDVLARTIGNAVDE